MERLDVSTRGKTDVRVNTPRANFGKFLLAPAVVLAAACGEEAAPKPPAQDGEVPVDGGQPVCAVGANRCEGNVLQTCKEGDGGVAEWTTLEDCGAAGTCNAEAAECTPVEQPQPEVASCEFTTKGAFLLNVVTADGSDVAVQTSEGANLAGRVVDQRVFAKEGEKVTLPGGSVSGSEGVYTVTRTEEGALLLVKESAANTVTVDVAEGSVKVQTGDAEQVYDNVNVVGLVSLVEVSRHEDNENYASRAAVTLTAGSRTKTFVLEQGNEEDVTSPDGSTTTTVRFVEGSNAEAVVDVSAVGDEFAVDPTMQRVGEGETVSYAGGAVSAKVESVTDEYDQSSTPKADHCREYAVTLLFNTGSDARDFDLVEGAELNVAGRQVTVEKVQYDDNAENRFVRLSIVAGTVTSTVVLRNGEMTTLEGGEVTQVVLVDMRSTELRPPVPPEEAPAP